jgi:hypothetical protein
VQIRELGQAGRTGMPIVWKLVDGGKKLEQEGEIPPLPVMQA